MIATYVAAVLCAVEIFTSIADVVANGVAVLINAIGGGVVEIGDAVACGIVRVVVNTLGIEDGATLEVIGVDEGGFRTVVESAVGGRGASPRVLVAVHVGIIQVYDGCRLG